MMYWVWCFSSLFGVKQVIGVLVSGDFFYVSDNIFENGSGVNPPET